MITSSREERDLLHSYQLGVNAYVVKPLKFSDFIAAVQQVGGFWAVVNEVPPGSTGRNEVPAALTTEHKQ
jgi:DNA-binding NarL/FixJ family response regulator